MTVSLEVAEDEFLRMCEAIDLEVDGLDDTEKESLEAQKKPIVKAIQAGRVTVDEAGMPTVLLKYPVDEVRQVVFKKPTAGMLVAAGDTKATNNMTKLYATLADMTGVPKTAFAKMHLRADFKLCEAIFSTFFG